MRTTLIAPVLALMLGTSPLLPATASAGAPAETEPPVPAPSETTERLRARVLGALRAELHAPLLSVVVDAVARLGAAEDGDVRGAARSALLAVDFAGISKQSKATVEAAVDLVVLQVGASVRANLLESIGRQQAFRAVRKCSGDSACVDAIVPTPTMTSASIQYVNALIAQNAADDAKTAEKAAADQTKQLRHIHNRTMTAQATLARQSADTARQIISKL